MQRGFIRIGMQFYRLAEIAEKKRLTAAVRTGKLASVTFHDQGRMGINEFSGHAWSLGRSNGWQVLTVRQKTPTISDTYEILLEPKGRPAMEALVGELERVRAHSIYE